jgi:phosphatidate cytidylyltransferase
MHAVSNFLNPFNNPVGVPMLERLAILYAIAVVILLVMKRGDFAAAWSSNIGRRIIGWLILTPLFFFGTFAGCIPGVIMLWLFMFGAVLEYAKIAKLDKSFRAALIVLSLVSVLVADYYTKLFYSLPLIYFLIITPVAIRLNKPERSFEQAAFSMYGAIWLLFSLSHLVLLTRLSLHFDNSHALTFLVIFAVAMADIGGFVFGKLFHHFGLLDEYKVADKLSPNKTYIGTLGYIIGAMAGIGFFYFAVGSYLHLWQWAIVAVVIGVFSFAGGLTHSYFKRYFGVKDSGTIIPGHGGIMDRIDSISRVGVILYYFLIVFVVK